MSNIIQKFQIGIKDVLKTQNGGDNIDMGGININKMGIMSGNS